MIEPDALSGPPLMGCGGVGGYEGARAKGSTDERAKRWAGVGPDASVMMDDGVGGASAARPPLLVESARADKCEDERPSP